MYYQVSFPPSLRRPREGKLDVHAVEPPLRNAFLEDLDRMDTEGVDEGGEAVMH